MFSSGIGGTVSPLSCHGLHDSHSLRHSQFIDLTVSRKDFQQPHECKLFSFIDFGNKALSGKVEMSVGPLQGREGRGALFSPQSFVRAHQ